MRMTSSSFVMRLMVELPLTGQLSLQRLLEDIARRDRKVMGCCGHFYHCFLPTCSLKATVHLPSRRCRRSHHHRQLVVRLCSMMLEDLGGISIRHSWIDCSFYLFALCCCWNATEFMIVNGGSVAEKMSVNVRYTRRPLLRLSLLLPTPFLAMVFIRSLILRGDE